jgi:hypothetical protein
LAALVVLGAWIGGCAKHPAIVLKHDRFRLEILGWVSEDTQVRRPGREAEIARAVETARFGARNLQVHIDTRFISVDPKFLSDIGVELDFTFVPPGGELIRPMSSRKIAEGPGFFTQRFTFQSPGLVDLIDQSFLAAGIELPPAGESPLEHISCLLRARATDTVLSAPKVALLSGQTSVLRVFTKKPYTVRVVGNDKSNDEADKVIAEIRNISLGSLFRAGAEGSAGNKEILVIVSPLISIHPGMPPGWENALKGLDLSRDATGRDPHHVKRPPETPPQVDAVEPGTR